jgi:hypothetical protein
VGFVFKSRGNRIHTVGNTGIYVTVACDCSSGGADSALSTRDTVIAAGGDLISMRYGNYARVDSAFVDSSSGGSGVDISSMTRGVVRDSRILHANTGIVLQDLTSLDLRRNTITGATSVGAYISSLADSATIVGNTIDSSGYNALWLTNGAAAIVDSNRFTNGTVDGLFFDNDGGARVTRSRIANNARYGVAMDNSYTRAPTLRNNIIAGNVLGGAANFSPSVTMDADSNYWGDQSGPRCSVNVTGCNTASTTGDLIVTTGINFADFLASPPTAPAPSAPAALRVASGARAPRTWTAASRAGAPPRPDARPRAAMRTARPTGPTPAMAAALAGQLAQRRPFPNAWQKGRQPRAPRPARAPNRP